MSSEFVRAAILLPGSPNSVPMRNFFTPSAVDFALQLVVDTSVSALFGIVYLIQYLNLLLLL